VYNIKIRRAALTGSFVPFEHREKTLWILSGLPIIYLRDRYVPTALSVAHEHTQLAGALFNVRWITPRLWWGEITTALLEQTDTITQLCRVRTLSRTGLDDIVCTIGKNNLLGERAQLACYGLLGLPTRTCVTAQEVLDPLVGTRFYGLGFGAELSYAFMQSLKRAFSGFLQGRFVHFFNRSWYPILPCSSRIEPGNITDIFIIARYREKLHIMEAGYNATFFTQQGVFTPPTRTTTDPFLRNSLYLSYTRGIMCVPGINLPGAVSTGINYSRTHFLNAQTFSWWFNMSIAF
jgi:hypothetical protein